MNEAMFPSLAAVGFFSFIGLLATVLTIIAYWRICEKAGFPGPLSLLVLIPIANIVLLLYIAFAEWPALKQKTDQPVQQPPVSSNV